MIHTNHISTTPASTSDFSSAIDRGTVPRAESDEKSEVLAGVVEIMLTVNYSHSGEVLRLLGTSPRGGRNGTNARAPTCLLWRTEAENFGGSWTTLQAEVDQAVNMRNVSEPQPAIFVYDSQPTRTLSAPSCAIV